MAKIDLPVRAFVEDFMRRAFPNRDFSRGSAINDLVIKAFSAILQPMRHEIDTIKLNQSVMNWQTMSREAMDALAANWGKFRQTGGRATGQVRLYFETATDYQLNYLEFYSTDGVSYVLASPVTISSGELLKNKRADGTYTYEVTVVSVGIGNRYAAAAGSVVGMTNPPSGLIRCENVSDFAVTAPDESNFDVVNAMYRNLGLRNLVSRQSIRAPLYEQFPGVLDIHITSSSDEKMVRDRITVDIDGLPTEVRLGGMSDIWINTTGVVSRQVQFSYTPATQKFKLVSAKQAQQTELIYSAPQIYLTLDGEYAAPAFLADIYELDESAQVVFDQGGLMSTALVATPKYQHRYNLATRDLVLGDSLVVFPSRYTAKSRYVTDALGIPFDTVGAQEGDLAILAGVSHRALKLSPRVMELAPGSVTEQDQPPPALFTYSVTTPVAAGGRAIPHPYVRLDLLPGGTIFDAGKKFYPGQRVTIVGSAAAGHYRLIEWSDENGDPSTTTGDGSYDDQRFFIGNIVAEGAIDSAPPVQVTPTTYKYTFTAVGGGPGHLPMDVDPTCWVYAHGGSDIGVHDPRPGSSGDWLPIVKVERTASSVSITVEGTTALTDHVTIVQGLRGDLTSGTPIFFENDGTSFRDSSIPVPFAQCNTRYVNATSIQLDPGVTQITEPGLGAAAAEGDLLVFEPLSIDGTMIALAGNTGDVHWTTPVAKVIDDDTVIIGLTPPVPILAGTSFALQRNSEVVTRLTSTLATQMLPTGTTVHVVGIGTASAVGDRVRFNTLQERALGTNAVTQYNPSITIAGVFSHPGIGLTSAVGDIVNVPAASYTTTVASVVDDDTVQLAAPPVSPINIGVTFSITRPGTYLVGVVDSITDADHVVISPPLRQTIPASTPVTVTRDDLRLASVRVTAAGVASITAVLDPVIPSGQSWPLGLGDGSGLPLRVINPRTGVVDFRTIRFSTGGSVRKIEMRAPSTVVPLVMSAAGYVPAQNTDIGQTVSQKLARRSMTSGTMAAALPGSNILAHPGIKNLAAEGDIVEFTIIGLPYSAKIVSFPDNDHAQLDGVPTTLLSTAAIAIGGSITTAGVFTSTGIGAAAAVGDTFEFAIIGVPYTSTVQSTSPPDALQFNTPYPGYTIPAGTVFKQRRPSVPGTGINYTVWRTDRTTTFVGTLRNFDNATYTWYVEPNDPSRDVFVADLRSTVTVANKQETNLIATIGAGQPFGYVDPVPGDIGLLVRQGSYAGVLTGYNGRNWEVKPLTEQDLFDDTDSQTFVDYLGTGKAGAHGYGHAAAAAVTGLIHTTGSTALSLEAPFPFDVVGTPADADPDAVESCIIEVLSRNGRTGYLGDNQAARTAPIAVLNPDSWLAADTANEQLMVVRGGAAGTYGLSTAEAYKLNLSSAIDTAYARLPNVQQSQKVTISLYIPAGTVVVSFPGSLIGAWGHKGRVLKLTVNGVDYFHTIDFPVDADTVSLVASEPTAVPMDASSTIAVEVVDGFISQAVRLLTAGVSAYRLVRPPSILEPVVLPVAGVNGTEDPSLDQFIDGLQDFGIALGGYDPSGTARDAWLALDSGNDASLVPKAITSLISSTAIGIEPDGLETAGSSVQYRILRRPGWLAMESWLPGTIESNSTIKILKSSLPAGWSWTRNGTFGQWSAHLARDTSADGPPVATPSWELPHCRIASIAEDATSWTLSVDIVHPNGLNFVPGVFEHVTGFVAGWISRPIRLVLRVLDRMMVRDVRANGIETFNYYRGAKFVLPVVRILAVEEVDPATQQPVGPVNYDFVVKDPGMRYSAREVNQLVLTDPNMHLKPIRVTYLSDATIEAMDNFVNNDDVRVLNCSQVVKRMETIAVDLQIQVRSTKSQADLIQLIASYINTLPSTTRVSKDGIIQFLYAQQAVTYINLSSMRLDGHYYPAENGVPVEYVDVDEVFGSATAAYIAGLISVTLVSG